MLRGLVGPAAPASGTLTGHGSLRGARVAASSTRVGSRGVRYAAAALARDVMHALADVKLAMVHSGPSERGRHPRRRHNVITTLRRARAIVLTTVVLALLAGPPASAVEPGSGGHGPWGDRVAANTDYEQGHLPNPAHLKPLALADGTELSTRLGEQSAPVLTRAGELSVGARARLVPPRNSRKANGDRTAIRSRTPCGIDVTHNVAVDWDTSTREGVDGALNEADVLGLRVATDGDSVDLLLHVLTLPAVGPLDPDARRIVRLVRPSRIRVLLRPDSPGGHYGPTVVLGGLDEVESFFESLAWGGSMYGWKFLDDPSLVDDWPTLPSLSVDLRPDPGEHSLYWFNECGREVGGQVSSFCIEGTVTFADLEVRRADGSPLTTEEFIADVRRYWTALRQGDDRLSVESQRAAQAGTPKWRQWAGEGVTITGELS